MPNWSDPVEIEKDAGIFLKFIFCLLGLLTWEIFGQLPFDISVISGRREARWPVFVYFYCKYSVFLAVIGVVIALNVTTEVNCQALYSFNQFAGNTAIGSASTLLMLRTIAIWNRKLIIVVPLVVLAVGQWGILFHGVATVHSSWVPAAGGCVVQSTKAVFIELIYLYTLSFDFIVLVLSIVGLVNSPGRSSLWQLLFVQGAFYFIVAFTSNTLAAVFLLLNLNPIMNIMFAVPAAVASSIVACRAFVSLTQFKTKDLYVHQTGQHVPGSQTRVGHQSVIISGGAGGPRKNGNTLAGLAFRGMDALAGGVDSMGNNLEDYGTMDSTVYGQSTIASKGGYLTKEVDIEMEAVEGEHQTRVVHTGQMRVKTHETGETMHGSDHKASFMPDV